MMEDLEDGIGGKDEPGSSPSTSTKPSYVFDLPDELSFLMTPQSPESETANNDGNDQDRYSPSRITPDDELEASVQRSSEVTETLQQNENEPCLPQNKLNTLISQIKATESPSPPSFFSSDGGFSLADEIISAAAAEKLSTTNVTDDNSNIDQHLSSLSSADSIIVNESVSDSQDAVKDNNSTVQIDNNDGVSDLDFILSALGDTAPVNVSSEATFEDSSELNKINSSKPSSIESSKLIGIDSIEHTTLIDSMKPTEIDSELPIQSDSEKPIPIESGKLIPVDDRKEILSNLKKQTPSDSRKFTSYDSRKLTLPRNKNPISNVSNDQIPTDVRQLPDIDIKTSTTTDDVDIPIATHVMESPKADIKKPTPIDSSTRRSLITTESSVSNKSSNSFSKATYISTFLDADIDIKRSLLDTKKTTKSDVNKLVPVDVKTSPLPAKHSTLFDTKKSSPFDTKNSTVPNKELVSLYAKKSALVDNKKDSALDNKSAPSIGSKHTDTINKEMSGANKLDKTPSSYPTKLSLIDKEHLVSHKSKKSIPSDRSNDKFTSADIKILSVENAPSKAIEVITLDSDSKSTYSNSGKTSSIRTTQSFESSISSVLLSLAAKLADSQTIESKSSKSIIDNDTLVSKSIPSETFDCISGNEAPSSKTVESDITDEISSDIITCAESVTSSETKIATKNISQVIGIKSTFTPNPRVLSLLPKLGKHEAKKRLMSFSGKTSFALNKITTKPSVKAAFNEDDIPSKISQSAASDMDDGKSNDKKDVIKKKKKKEKVSFIEQIRSEETEFKNALGLKYMPFDAYNKDLTNLEHLKRLKEQNKLIEKNMKERAEKDDLNKDKKDDRSRSPSPEKSSKRFRDSSDISDSHYRRKSKRIPKSWKEFKREEHTFESLKKLMEYSNSRRSYSRSPSRERERNYSYERYHRGRGRGRGRGHDYGFSTHYKRSKYHSPPRHSSSWKNHDRIKTMNCLYAKPIYHGSKHKEFPGSFVKYTNCLPALSYCINSDVYSVHYESRREVMHSQSGEICRIIEKFWKIPDSWKFSIVSKDVHDEQKMRSWYVKDWDPITNCVVEFEDDAETLKSKWDSEEEANHSGKSRKKQQLADLKDDQNSKNVAVHTDNEAKDKENNIEKELCESKDRDNLKNNKTEKSNVISDSDIAEKSVEDEHKPHEMMEHIEDHHGNSGQETMNVDEKHIEDICNITKSSLNEENPKIDSTESVSEKKPDIKNNTMAENESEEKQQITESDLDEKHHNDEKNIEGRKVVDETLINIKARKIVDETLILENRKINIKGKKVVDETSIMENRKINIKARKIVDETSILENRKINIKGKKVVDETSINIKARKVVDETSIIENRKINIKARKVVDETSIIENRKINIKGKKVVDETSILENRKTSNIESKQHVDDSGSDLENDPEEKETDSLHKGNISNSFSDGLNEEYEAFMQMVGEPTPKEEDDLELFLQQGKQQTKDETKDDADNLQKEMYEESESSDENERPKSEDVSSSESVQQQESEDEEEIVEKKQHSKNQEEKMRKQEKRQEKRIKKQLKKKKKEDKRAKKSAKKEKKKREKEIKKKEKKALKLKKKLEKAKKLAAKERSKCKNSNEWNEDDAEEWTSFSSYNQEENKSQKDYYKSSEPFERVANESDQEHWREDYNQQEKVNNNHNRNVDQKVECEQENDSNDIQEITTRVTRQWDESSQNDTVKSDSNKWISDEESLNDQVRDGTYASGVDVEDNGSKDIWNEHESSSPYSYTPPPPIISSPPTQSSSSDISQIEEISVKHHAVTLMLSTGEEDGKQEPRQKSKPSTEDFSGTSDSRYTSSAAPCPSSLASLFSNLRKGKSTTSKTEESFPSIVTDIISLASTFPTTDVSEPQPVSVVSNSFTENQGYSSTSQLKLDPEINEVVGKFGKTESLCKSGGVKHRSIIKDLHTSGHDGFLVKDGHGERTLQEDQSNLIKIIPDIEKNENIVIRKERKVAYPSYYSSNIKYEKRDSSSSKYSSGKRPLQSPPDSPENHEIKSDSCYSKSSPQRKLQRSSSPNRSASPIKSRSSRSRSRSPVGRSSPHGRSPNRSISSKKLQTSKYTTSPEPYRSRSPRRSQSPQKYAYSPRRYSSPNRNYSKAEPRESTSKSVSLSPTRALKRTLSSEKRRSRSPSPISKISSQDWHLRDTSPHAPDIKSHHGPHTPDRPKPLSPTDGYYKKTTGSHSPSTLSLKEKKPRRQSRTPSPKQKCFKRRNSRSPEYRSSRYSSGYHSPIPRRSSLSPGRPSPIRRSPGRFSPSSNSTTKRSQEKSSPSTLSPRRHSPKRHTSDNYSPQRQTSRKQSPKLDWRNSPKRSRDSSWSPKRSSYRHQSPTRELSRSLQSDYSPSKSRRPMSPYSLSRLQEQEIKKDWDRETSKFCKKEIKNKRSPSRSLKHTGLADEPEKEKHSIQSISTHYSSLKRHEPTIKIDADSTISDSELAGRITNKVSKDQSLSISPISSPPRLSLDERLKQEHGLTLQEEEKLAPTPTPPVASTIDWRYPPPSVYQVPGTVANVPQTSQVIRVGNVLQVLPQEAAVMQHHTLTLRMDTAATDTASTIISAPMIVQSGNVIQVVPADSAHMQTSGAQVIGSGLQKSGLGQIGNRVSSTRPHPNASPVPLVVVSGRTSTSSVQPCQSPVAASMEPDSGEKPTISNILLGHTTASRGGQVCTPPPNDQLLQQDPSETTSPVITSLNISSPTLATAAAAAAAEVAAITGSVPVPVAHLLSVLQQQQELISKKQQQQSSIICADGNITSTTTIAAISSVSDIDPIALEKQRAEKAKKERREQREKKRVEREKRREARKQRALQDQAEELVQQQLLLEASADTTKMNNFQFSDEDEEALIKEAISETPMMGSPIPDYYDDDDDDDDSDDDYETRRRRRGKPVRILLPPAEKGILLSPSYRGRIEYQRKVVKFADGVMPGDGTSPSGGEEIHSPPPQNSEETNVKKPKTKKLKKKRKVKVKLIKQYTLDRMDADSPPPPPPSSPPPRDAFKLYPGCNHYTYTAPGTAVIYTDQSPTTTVSHPFVPLAGTNIGPSRNNVLMQGCGVPTNNVMSPVNVGLNQMGPPSGITMLSPGITNNVLRSPSNMTTAGGMRLPSVVTSNVRISQTTPLVVVGGGVNLNSPKVQSPRNVTGSPSTTTHPVYPFPGTMYPPPPSPLATAHTLQLQYLQANGHPPPPKRHTK